MLAGLYRPCMLTVDEDQGNKEISTLDIRLVVSYVQDKDGFHERGLKPIFPQQVASSVSNSPNLLAENRQVLRIRQTGAVCPRTLAIAIEYMYMCRRRMSRQPYFTSLLLKVLHTSVCV